ncbi:plasmid maintenance system killer protein [Pontibacter diazotrophicus]|uniref:Plasmid maintenance system killer protein n=1 Tax=Pontibacter diazotrophicus TaxID=1400979 RepID=A0A3D8L032_9BACT|nr:type II toxin-antitoxin system RelE/ParE family toxin [Pontibacter diazotrophicus]RDV10743.1 plasmid maintenance system killer protein [Pontibacter diazotrophicus]
MEIIFSNEELETLYEGKKVKNKEFMSNPQLIKQFKKTVDKLRAVTRIEHLQQFTSLNYHKLKGDRIGHSTVYVNKQYRIIFSEIADENPPHEIRLLALEELSKHYE